MAHPISQSCLERFARGRASRDERGKVLAHLLRGCPACREALQPYLEPSSRAELSELDLERLTRRWLPDSDEPGRAPNRPASTSAWRG